MTDMSNNDSDSERDNSGNQYGLDNSGNQSGNGNSQNQVVPDSSGNVILDPSCNIVLPPIVPITDVSSNVVIDGIGFEIVQETGKSAARCKYCTNHV